MNQPVQKAQKIMLNLLQEFDRICKKHNLTYWLDFGTLLGAVRHKGFIPWDDDLDVSMPHDDYKKFLQIATDELPESMFLQTKKTDPYALNFFAKIRDRKSTLIDAWEANRNIRYHQGIFMDIFPAMRVTRNTLKSKRFRGLVMASKITHNRYIHLDGLTRIFVQAANRFADRNGEYLISSAETMHYLKPIHVSDFFPLQEIRFEDRMFPAPGNTDAYLKVIFGDDYRLLPPKEKRSMHSVMIDTNTPCRWEKEHG